MQAIGKIKKQIKFDMELTTKLKQYLSKYIELKDITYSELVSKCNTPQYSFVRSEVENKEIYLLDIENSFFNEIEILLDHKLNKSSLTYIAYLNENKKQELESFIRELYSCSKKIFKKIEKDDCHSENNVFVWSYSLENDKFLLGI